MLLYLVDLDHQRRGNIVLGHARPRLIQPPFQVRDLIPRLDALQALELDLQIVDLDHEARRCRVRRDARPGLRQSLLHRGNLFLDRSPFIAHLGSLL